MIKWNKSSFDLLRDYIYNLWDLSMRFFLLSWPENIWKSTYVEQLSKDFLWETYKNDFLQIKDLSNKSYIKNWKVEKIKNHILKIEKPAKNSLIQLSDWTYYEDLWVRDIINWINIRPLWEYKIVLLENMERMNIESSNSFLKTLEDTPNNVIIIWTTKNKDLILDTIRSRAKIIRFNLPSNEDILETLNNEFPDIEDNKKKLASLLSINRIWFAIWLLNQSKDEKFENTLLWKYEKFLKLLSINWSLKEKRIIISEFYENWYFDLFIDAIVRYYDSVVDYSKIDYLNKAKLYIRNNVSPENVIYYLAINL